MFKDETTNPESSTSSQQKKIYAFKSDTDASETRTSVIMISSTSTVEKIQTTKYSKNIAMTEHIQALSTGKILSILIYPVQIALRN